ncbi:ABC transporter ATP-binding protein [Amnibacterium endophyticum]|uniref:ABC transporter ATP-binding protein n=1 Tax=Amnibacterium endophyticum TaxID=2109337 RepID=A0ABW4LFS1_9MICO
MSAPLLRLTGVVQRYGTGETAVTALDGVDLEVVPGELVAVMGTSGSGKSSLLSIAGGLAAPTSGTVEVDGVDIASLAPRRVAALRRTTLGFVFQDYNLVPTLTAAENVGLPLELDGWPRRKVRRAALDALAAVELSAQAGRFPDDLSGGQQQRVAIARAVVGPRRLILADEPTGALDSHTGEIVLRMLRARIDAGAGGVLVTHDARHAAWADRIVFLRDGRVADTARASRPESLLEDVR